MQMISKKCPFKENCKLSKLFRLVLLGLNLPAGSDTLQNKILRGIRPRRTRSCGVSDSTELSLAGVSNPAEQWQSCVHFIADTYSARSDTPQTCGVWYPAQQSPAGYQTLWGIKPCGTTSKYEYFCKFETEFKNILGCEFNIAGHRHWHSGIPNFSPVLD